LDFGWLILDCGGSDLAFQSKITNPKSKIEGLGVTTLWFSPNPLDTIDSSFGAVVRFESRPPRIGRP
jgi:hypothetical protein